MITGEVGSDLSLYVGYTSRRRFVPNEIHFGRSVCTQQRLENLAAVVVTGPQVLSGSRIVIEKMTIREPLGVAHIW